MAASAPNVRSDAGGRPLERCVRPGRAPVPRLPGSRLATPACATTPAHLPTWLPRPPTSDLTLEGVRWSGVLGQDVPPCPACLVPVLPRPRAPPPPHTCPHGCLGPQRPI